MPRGSNLLHDEPGAHRHPRRACWSISDTGVGFGQGEPAQTGFGIGLSLVERLALRFRWAMTIQPNAPHGTQVRLTWTP
ncbi:hypothetical protein LZ198_03165 [Myxococcus sp. K15C18031901]|uniref:ATP-binding protein n=1 Tax=Myxococcus dinghuensis TaxID=2906761 RepID=UPI0020A81DA8|nr:hypothetical protein [Myxococcus dinghuensis]MCP3097871.1 hypothetical protein [Myxococcus dinghuensis]